MNLIKLLIFLFVWQITLLQGALQWKGPGETIEEHQLGHKNI